MDNTNAQDPRSVAEEVIKELELEQAQPKPEPEAERKAEPEKVEKLEEKPEPKTEPEKEVEEEKAERPERKSKFVPVTKANAWRHEANEAKAKIAELEKQLAERAAATESKKADDLEAKAKEIAGEEASPEVVKRILEAAKSLVSKEPDKDIEDLKQLRQTMLKQNEEQAFARELNQTIGKFPELKGHEAALEELAYAEGNEKIPLELLAYKLRDDLNLSPAPPSAEGRSSKPVEKETKDFASMTEKDIDALSGKELDDFIDWQQNGVRSRTGIRI